MADGQQTLDQQTPEQSTGVTRNLTAHARGLEEQLTATQDQVLCMVADLQNVCRHTKQDVGRVHRFALEKPADDLLAVVDASERDLRMFDSNDEAIKPVCERVELTLKMFGDTLRRYQVETLDPEGKSFSPEQHQAVAMQEGVSVEPGSVLGVFQKGYLLDDCLLRPATTVASEVLVETPLSIDEQT